MLKGGGKMKGEYLFTIDSAHSDPNTDKYKCCRSTK